MMVSERCKACKEADEEISKELAKNQPRDWIPKILNNIGEDLENNCTCKDRKERP